jgi:hypothetical protein
MRQAPEFGSIALVMSRPAKIFRVRYCSLEARYLINGANKKALALNVETMRVIERLL